MRVQFLEGLTKLAEEDSRVVLITADLGFGSIEVFSQLHSQRYFNLGVTEQAIVGVATGLAEGGFIPYCYSIASFSVARTFEFLRNGPIAHQLPVRVIGVGPGFDYSFDGLTHYALEDLALMGSQPQTKIVAPVDGDRAFAVGENGFEDEGLVYIRLARSVSPSSIPILSKETKLSPVVVLGYGDSSAKTQELVELMRASGVEASSAMVEEISKDSLEDIAQLMSENSVKLLVTVENHYVRGGFGSMVTDALMERGWSGLIKKWGIESLPNSFVGSSDYMMKEYCTKDSEVLNFVLRNLG